MKGIMLGGDIPLTYNIVNYWYRQGVRYFGISVKYLQRGLGNRHLEAVSYSIKGNRDLDDTLTLSQVNVILGQLEDVHLIIFPEGLIRDYGSFSRDILELKVYLNIDMVVGYKELSKEYNPIEIVRDWGVDREEVLYLKNTWDY